MFIDVITKADSKTIQINPAQICWIDGNLLTFGNGLTIEIDDFSMKEVRLATAPKGKQTKSTDADPKLLELFNKLHTLTKGKGKPVFSLQREKQLKDLLGKHRMTEEQLIKAATNIGNDAFLQGDNDSNKRYGDVDYLLRPAKAAKWADEAEKKKKGMF